MRLEGNDLKLPVYKTDGASGFDLMACIDENIVLLPSETKIIATGFIFEIPYGYEMEIRPRSGLAIKNGITVLNSPGTIDSDYRGEVKIILHNSSRVNFTIERGFRIAQAVLKESIRANIIETKNVSDTLRGVGGFGHTGV